MEQRYIELYDKYTHSTMPRREFLDRLIKLAGGTAAALALLPMLENDYAAAAETDDKKINSKYVEYKGASGTMRAFAAHPRVHKPGAPAVVVIHENKGLNPHIEDVAKRAASAGFFALAPDALSPLGGTPDDRDKARTMIRQLDRKTTVADFVAAVDHLAGNEPIANVGCVGFCWGGSMANQLAVNSQKMKAAVAFYGSQPSADDVPRIKGAVQLHYAEMDPRINRGIDAYREALEKSDTDYELYMYEGVNHAFHNDSNKARYNKEAATLAWSRTIAFWKKHLIGGTK